jgi:hypothetical protein
MTRQLTVLILIAAATFGGCQKQKQNSSTKETEEKTVKSAKLVTRLGTAAEVFTNDSIPLSFTVVNDADTVQHFCKWETPFEPRLGKYIEVMDEQGTEAPFKGAMARRVMPPPAESYIAVSAHDSVRTVFNLAKNYTVKSGQYTLKYTGGGVSGLDAGNEIKIKVSNP